MDPLSPYFLKFNVDGAFDAGPGWRGVGIVIQNEQGQIRSMTTILSLHVASIEMAEAMGFRSALEDINTKDGQKYLAKGRKGTVKKLSTW